MSIFRKSANIPAATTTSIGGYGAAVPVGRLVLNGPIVSQYGTVSFISNGYASSVTIQSAGNVSGINFTIVGTGNNGVNITEVIVGANANSVFTNNLFETVLSITIDAAPPGGTGFAIGSNANVAIVLNGYNTGASNNVNVNYSTLVNSLTAAGQWAAGGLIIYGVAGNTPSLITRTNLAHATRANNYKALNDPAAATTQANLNAGLITQTTYPFGAVVIAILNGVNTTPAFVEITQS
jgi:hypothetical protein